MRSLRRDSRGVTAVEFALVSPVMFLGIMGLSDLAYRGYAQAILEGAVQKAGRDAAIQGGANRTVALDDAVLAEVKRISNSATYTSSRRSYDNFATVGPERFTDSNNNGRRDARECFDDINGNGIWDSDPGTTGQGGANDITLYRIEVTYNRIFPLGRMLGWGSTQTIAAQTLLKNQPYATQSVNTVTTICT